MEAREDYHISISVNEGIIEVVITGEVTKNTIGTLHSDVIAGMKGKNARAVLTDVRFLKGHRDPLSEAYFRVRSIPREILRMPSAVVDLSGDAAYQSFYETTAANAGMSLKWFTDIEEARAWLKSRL